MSKFFLDIPRDRYFDSVSSISLKSSTIITLDSKVPQGLVMLSNLFWEKSQKKACFITWKHQSQQSIYSLWKDLIKEEASLPEFEVILKILNKRKSEVDQTWAMLKTQEKKHEELLKLNQNLQEMNANMKIKSLEHRDKGVQVSFLQDILLKRTHKELIELEKNLSAKELQLNAFEIYLTDRFDQLVLREKRLHNKESGFFNVEELNNKENIKQFCEDYRTEIFQEKIEDNLWLQLVDPAFVTSEQLEKLREYEKSLYQKHEEVDKKLPIIKQALAYIENLKLELLEREAKVTGLEAIKEELEKEKEEMRKQMELIEEANAQIELQRSLLKNHTKTKKTDEWVLELKPLNTECENVEILKIGLQEMASMQQNGIIDENLTEGMIESIIRFGEKLLHMESDFQKISAAKSAYLDAQRNNIEDLKKMLILEHSLLGSQKELQLEESSRKNSEIEIYKFIEMHDTVLENHLFSIDKSILEIQQEEARVKQLECENEKNYYSTLSLDLQEKVADYDNKLFEVKTILQLLHRVSAGNLEIFKQEISRILIKHEKNSEFGSTVKKITAVYMWLRRSYDMASGKFLLQMKLSFYLIRLRVVMLKKGLSVAPIYFDMPSDTIWLEIFWLRTRHIYFTSPLSSPKLVSLTKHWYMKFIISKLRNSFKTMETSHKKSLSAAFYSLRNKCIENDKQKAICLYSQLLRIRDKSIQDIRKDLNLRAACKIIPLFERFNRIWDLHKKIFLLQWKNHSEKIEKKYLQSTIYEIYMNLSEMMLKEHKFKEECRNNQIELRNKIFENNKLIDRILYLDALELSSDILESIISNFLRAVIEIRCCGITELISLIMPTKNELWLASDSIIGTLRSIKSFSA